MSRRQKQAKPKPVVLDPYTARVIRGPHKRDASKWYWRISDGREAAGCMWGTKTEITKDLANRVAGVDTKEEEEEQQHPTTFGELASRWLAQQESRSRLSPLTLRAWQGSVRRLLTVAGDWPLHQVKHNYHLLRDHTDFRKSTLTSDLKIARRIMNFGELRDWCSSILPSLSIRGDDPERVTPTAETTDRVYGYLEALEHKLAFSILRVTGCRGIALERLAWEEVDFEAGELKLTGKGGAKREVPVPEHLLNLLRQWKEQQGNPSTGTVFAPGSSNRVRRRIQRVCAKQRVSHFSLHGLRRLRVREYRRGGVDVVVAAALLGHSPVVMMKLYDEASKEEKHEALQTLWAKERQTDKEPDNGDPSPPK